MGSDSRIVPTEKPCTTAYNDRRSLSAGDLTDEELAAIARAEIPAAERYRVKDLRPKPQR